MQSSAVAASWFAFLFCACAAPSGPQVVTGKVDQASFASPIGSVRVVRSGWVIARSTVAADGTFQLVIPRGRSYRIAFVPQVAVPSAFRPLTRLRLGAGISNSGLVFPRQDGRVGIRFSVFAGARSLDLGTVRHIGDATTRQFLFSASLNPPNASGTGDSGDCEDGVDPATGAMCVDDQQGGDQEGESCGGDDGDGDHQDGDHHDGQCENGLDAVTGAACADGNDDHADLTVDQGDMEDGDHAACQNGASPDGASCAPDDGDTQIQGDAVVAEHNLPESIGCSAGGGEED
jgi:hypothetical protein